MHQDSGLRIDQFRTYCDPHTRCAHLPQLLISRHTMKPPPVHDPMQQSKAGDPLIVRGWDGEPETGCCSLLKCCGDGSCDCKQGWCGHNFKRTGRSAVIACLVVDPAPLARDQERCVVWQGRVLPRVLVPLHPLCAQTPLALHTSGVSSWKASTDPHHRALLQGLNMRDGHQRSVATQAAVFFFLLIFPGIFWEVWSLTTVNPQATARTDCLVRTPTKHLRSAAGCT